MPAYLYDLIARRAPSPQKVFIETPDGRKITYGDLHAGSGRLANALARARREGRRPRRRAGREIADAVLLYLACLRAGAVFLPLNTAYTPAEIDYFLGDAEPQVFVCDPASRDKLASVAGAAGVAHVETLGVKEDGSLIEAARAMSTDFTDADRSQDDLAAILYTSGTTGRSKGAMLTHGNLASNALTLVDDWRFTDDDVLIHALPIYHTHGLFVAINTLLLSGGSMFFLPKFDADLMLQLMPRRHNDDGRADLLHAPAGSIRA